MMRRSLSSIEEGYCISKHLFLSIVGPDAWRKSGKLREIGLSMFPKLEASEPNSPASPFGEVLSSGSQSTYPSPSQKFPVSVSVLVDLSFSKLTRTRTFETCASCDPLSSSYGSAVQDVTMGSQQAVRFHIRPVEFFSEDMSPCDSLDNWRHSFVLFLLDTRRESCDAEMMNDLERQRQHVARWMKSGSFARGRRAPPLLLAILIHAGVGLRHQDVEPSHFFCGQQLIDDRSCQQSSDGIPPGLSQKHIAFIDAVREMASPPEDGRICFCTDFDDSTAFLRAVMGICKQGLVSRNARHYVSEVAQLNLPSEQASTWHRKMAWSPRPFQAPSLSKACVLM